ncbi:glycosyltransferase family 4 protein [Halobacterium salinarum]|uniref:glycosyltransferase family 4 protein n=1 Tax=Halobacterium salinarum TaxID=2242 RepID=UPI001F251879|nr:glycosyltransferase family 4 protein [Halobacterium salinarum]MCF2238004.1 glycosyltransferase family 4 protein [Halobacterium salinarum]
MENAMESNDDILVVSTSDRGEKITRPLSMVGVETANFKLSDISDVVGLYQTIKRCEPEVVIVDSFSFGGASVALSCLASSTPYVIRVRGDPIREHSEWLRVHMKNREFLRALKQLPRYIGTKTTLLATDHYVFVSDYLKRLYDPAGDKSRVINTPCFMLDESSGAEEYNLELDNVVKDNVVLAVTNMNYPAKVAGLRDALNPISTVLERRRDTTMLIAGDGPYYDDIVKQSESLEGDIRTPGYIPNIQPLFERADVFAHFSYLDGYPSTILEAYASKTPVLANDAVGMSEQIVDGETGYLVDLDDPSEVIQHLEYLLDSPNLKEKFGDAGHDQAQNNNTTERIGEQFKSYLSKFVNE